jgi:hypothetical protein
MGAAPAAGTAHQFQVPEATHHAGTANVTAAMTATTVTATQRRPSTLLIVTGTSSYARAMPICTRGHAGGGRARGRPSITGLTVMLRYHL